MPDFIDRIKYYDEVSTISILLEPWNYHYISGVLRWSFDITKEEQKRRLEEHKQLVIQFCNHITEEQIFYIRQELCIKAELLEPNKNLHTMIRFTIGKYTLKLKGELGGAIILLLMAEIIRTTYEKIFDKELKEEDEMGFGVMPLDLKKRLYGNTRLMGGDKKAEKNFMAQFGLDYSTKMRFYFEGYTELGAIKPLFEHHNAFEFINLSGEFVEGRKKGLTFVGNLKNDINKGVFSIIFIDSDQNDNLRLLKNAVQRDEFFGMWFASEPDFEMNFTHKELINALFLMAKRYQTNLTVKKQEVIKKVSTVVSGKDFFRIITKIPELSRYSKGEEWGFNLMESLQNPKESRPLFDFIRRTMQLLAAGYHYYRTNHKIDIETGQLALKKTV